ncbi:Lipase maturation factor 1 [Varanus komodoensis]|nr:Lipase maturation factor 1 [Varanus komodoensis]
MGSVRKDAWEEERSQDLLRGFLPFETSGAHKKGSTHNSPLSSRPIFLILNTQPVPNPVAYYMHRSPWWFHQCETVFNHFIELAVPFLLFLGRRMCILHGILQILFQVRAALRLHSHHFFWETRSPLLRPLCKRL